MPKHRDTTMESGLYKLQLALTQISHGRKGQGKNEVIPQADICILQETRENNAGRLS